MKTERIGLLVTSDFKTFLMSEAKREKVSVGELIRTRCEQRPSEDEAILIELVAELRDRVRDAKKSLKEGLDEAHTTLAELRASKVDMPVAPRQSRKVLGARA